MGTRHHGIPLTLQLCWLVNVTQSARDYRSFCATQWHSNLSLDQHTPLVSLHHKRSHETIDHCAGAFGSPLLLTLLSLRQAVVLSHMRLTFIASGA